MAERRPDGDVRLGHSGGFTTSEAERSARALGQLLKISVE